jgi:hypothetical protein
MASILSVERVNVLIIINAGTRIAVQPKVKIIEK